MTHGDEEEEGIINPGDNPEFNNYSTLSLKTAEHTTVDRGHWYGCCSPTTYFFAYKLGKLTVVNTDSSERVPAWWLHWYLLSITVVTGGWGVRRGLRGGGWGEGMVVMIPWQWTGREWWGGRSTPLTSWLCGFSLWNMRLIIREAAAAAVRLSFTPGSQWTLELNQGHTGRIWLSGHKLVKFIFLVNLNIPDFKRQKTDWIKTPPCCPWPLKVYLQFTL